MLPNLAAIETRAGRIAIGAEVKSTRYPVQGLVTAIVWAGYFYAIQVDNRHSDDAAHYELLSPPTHQGFNYVNPFAQQATKGNFEVLLPGEGDRIYFADDAHQAIALLAASIGLQDPQQEVEHLQRRAEAGPVDELRWRGQAVGGLVGQLAYISTGRERPGPQFQVGQQVYFYSPHTPHTVSGRALYKDRRNYGKTQWHYFHEQANATHHPIDESSTTAAPPQVEHQVEHQVEQPEATATAPGAAAVPGAAAPQELSQAAQFLISNQPATVQHVAQQMQAGPRKAAKLYKEMQQLYGPVPTLLQLALFSGAADLVAMIKQLKQTEAEAV